MSTFGSPGGAQKFSRPIPPQRGSFPLDHDAECQPLMKRYLTCIKSNRGVPSEECRGLSKAYLQCRMDCNLMAIDSMRNLGFQDQNQGQSQGLDHSGRDQEGREGGGREGERGQRGG